ncbi:hypothetical protein NE237_026608 [Protea cynaroides]|uniref:Uncharacterized protein n=1 Tax=Protea cynaroides TaxID=273540 RepID=A0A9Q0H421_9MAGN|nr:hypothetical protein NE237_026608 [Protea cynaroides]
MPKDRRGRSVSSERSRLSPFPCSSNWSRQSSSKNPLEPVEDAREWEEATQSASEKSLQSADDVKEWEDARCPVCMEHPHNAVLLLCSSHDKGCRPYMCDTSYRHSNCLDQFRKAFAEAPSTTVQDSIPDMMSSEATHRDAQDVMYEQTLNSSILPSARHSLYAQDVMNEQTSNSSILPSARHSLYAQDVTNEQTSNSSVLLSARHSQTELLCPLCRGMINGWRVVEAARRFMNAKARSCASETCDFFGTYSDLRTHARLEHPLVRPSVADPERQRDWRNLERQRDLGDVLSTIQSAFVEERIQDDMFTVDNGRLLTVFYFVFRPRSSTRGRWSGASIIRGQARSRTRTMHWGEGDDIDTGSASGEDENNPLEGISRAWRRRERSRRRPTPESEP